MSRSVQSHLAHPVSQDVIQSAQKSMMEQNVWSNVLLMIQDRTANLSTAEYDKKWPAIDSGTPWENDRAIGIGCSVRTCARCASNSFGLCDNNWILCQTAMQTLQSTLMGVMNEGFGAVANQMTSQMMEIGRAQAVSLSRFSALCSNCDSDLQDVIKQATDHINSISTSMKDTSVSIQQTGEEFQFTMTQAKMATCTGQQRNRNGYDGDTENMPDRRTGPKPSKILNLHVRPQLWYRFSAY